MMPNSCEVLESIPLSCKEKVMGDHMGVSKSGTCMFQYHLCPHYQSEFTLMGCVKFKEASTLNYQADS